MHEPGSDGLAMSEMPGASGRRSTSRARGLVVPEGQGSDNNHLSLSTSGQVYADGSRCNQLREDSPGACAVRTYLDACWADATKRAYAGDVRDFVAWGGGVPASAETVARYIADRASTLAPATLARRLVGIGAMHVAAGFQDPTKQHLVRMVLKGVRRTHSVAQRGAQPIDPRKWGRAWAGAGGVREARDKALVLLGFSAAFRRSELVSLDVGDLSWSSGGLSLRLRKSKTDQEGRSRAVAVPRVDRGFCAVRAVEEWLTVGKIESGALFRSVDRNGRVGPRLHAQSVSLIVKKLAAAEGLSDGTVSGHSLRAGFVTEAAKAGADLVSIRRQTGHASLDMLSRYIRSIDPFVWNAHRWLR